MRRFRPDPVPGRRARASARGSPPRAVRGPHAAWRLSWCADWSPARVRAAGRARAPAPGRRFDERARQFLDQKSRHRRSAARALRLLRPRDRPDEVLGRGTIPETDVYSTACAIENLWLAARAEGLGVGWVSFYRPDDLRAVLGSRRGRADRLPLRGLARRAPVRPGLEAAGWSSRVPLDDVVMESAGAAAIGGARRRCGDRPDRAAAIAARDRLDRSSSRPAASARSRRHRALGVDHGRARRRRPCAPACWSAPPTTATPAGTSLFDARSAPGPAARPRGETAVGVLARARTRPSGRRRRPRGPTPPAARPPGRRRTADMRRPALDARAQLDAALAAGARLAASSTEAGVDCLVLGEIGIGNTATAAALPCALTGAPRRLARGTGLDAAGLGAQARSGRRRARARAGGGARRRATRCSRSAARARGPRGGLGAPPTRATPVILDGFATASPRSARSASPACASRCRRPPLGRARPCARARPRWGSSHCSTCACAWARPAAPLLALPLIEQAGRPAPRDGDLRRGRRRWAVTGGPATRARPGGAPAAF